MLLHTVNKITSFTAELRHLRFSMVEQFSGKNQIKAVSIYLSRKKFFLFQLPTHKKKSYLPYWFTIFHMCIEEILSPKTFITEKTSTSLQNVWLLLLVNISSKLFTISESFEIPTFFMNKLQNILSKPSKVLYQYHLVFPWLSQFFLKDCLLQFRSWSTFKKRKL